MNETGAIRAVLEFTSEAYADPNMQAFGLAEAWKKAERLGATKETYTVKTRVLRRDGLTEMVYPDLFTNPSADVVVAYTFRRTVEGSPS